MNRRELREHIFRLLFRAAFYRPEDMQEQEDLYLDAIVDLYPEAEEETIQKDILYIRTKTEGIRAHLQELDDKVNNVATGWKTGRMGTVDLTIIRLALYEMLYDDDIPTGVAINEAVELAKKYGTDDSPSFVNGILARLA